MAVSRHWADEYKEFHYRGIGETQAMAIQELNFRQKQLHLGRKYAEAYMPMFHVDLQGECAPVGALPPPVPKKDLKALIAYYYKR